MLELSILISSVIANGLISLFKAPKDPYDDPEDLATRKTILRVFNAGIGVVVMVFTYSLMGGEVDKDQLSSQIEIVVAGLLTYATSQGLFHLRKKN